MPAASGKSANPVEVSSGLPAFVPYKARQRDGGRDHAGGALPEVEGNVKRRQLEGDVRKAQVPHWVSRCGSCRVALLHSEGRFWFPRFCWRFYP
jgi:hypothetical protein